MARTSLLCLFASATIASPAAAQPRTVLVLPWSLADADGATLAARAEAVAGAVPTGELSALSIADARSRFEEHGSAEPHPMSDGDLDRWLALSRQAVRQLAHADYAAAAQTLRDAQALSEPAAAELNREESRARQVLDTCLFEVRGLVETHDPRARTRAIECRRLVPRIAPSPYIHTPEVVELMADVDRQLASAPPGSLRVESAPSGCHVRLNGVPVGDTPFVSEDLAAGEYRAQIECGDEATAPRGRVHRIRLAEGSSTVGIDMRFDSVVRTDVALRLAYATRGDADAHRLADATSAATTVGAAEVWLLSAESLTSSDVIRLDRIDVARGEVLASVRAHADRGLASAIASLARGSSQDFTGESPVALATWGATSSSSSAVGSESVEAPRAPFVPQPRADWELAVGGTLGVLGIAAFVTSLALLETERGYGHLATQPLVGDPDYLTRRATWTSWEAPVLALGWVGAALTTAALPLVMLDEDGAPWWSWVIGALGLGAIGTGVGLAASAHGCGNDRPNDTCVGETELAGAGSTIASMGAPLFAVPFVYLIRSAVGRGSSITPSASVSALGASVGLGGTW